MNTKMFLACVLLCGLVASAAQAAQSIFTPEDSPPGNGVSELLWNGTAWSIPTGGGAFAGGGGTGGVPNGTADSLYYLAMAGIDTYAINIHDNFTFASSQQNANWACFIVGTIGGNNSYANYILNIATGKTLTLAPSTNTNTRSIEVYGSANLTINGNVEITRIDAITTQIVNHGAGHLVFNNTLTVNKITTGTNAVAFGNITSGNIDIAEMKGDSPTTIGAAGTNIATTTGAVILRDTTQYTGSVTYAANGHLVLATPNADNVTMPNNTVSSITSLRLGNGVNYSKALDMRNTGSGTTFAKTLGAWGDGATALAPQTATFSGTIAVSAGGAGSVTLNLNAPAYTTLNITGNITGGTNTSGMSITGAGKVVISSSVAANIFSVLNSTLSIANNSTLTLAGAASLLAPSMTFNVADTTAGQLDVSAATAFAWTGAFNLSLIGVSWSDTVDKEWQLFKGVDGTKTLSLSALTATDMSLTFVQNGNQWTATDYMDREWTFDQSNGKLYLGVIPEPASLALLGMSLLVVTVLRRKKLS